MNSKPNRPELANARQQGFHNIGEAAALAGMNAKMIRHYEGVGLIPQATRTFAGYRLYSDSDVHRLRFIRRARGLGFSIKQIAALLGLWDDRSRASSEVKQLAREHAEELRLKILEMESMRQALETLAERCHGDARSDCPILEDLGSTSPLSSSKAGLKAKKKTTALTGTDQGLDIQTKKGQRSSASENGARTAAGSGKPSGTLACSHQHRRDIP